MSATAARCRSASRYFFVIPSAIAFLALGDIIAAAIYQSGRSTYDDAVYGKILAVRRLGCLPYRSPLCLGVLCVCDTHTSYFAVVRIAMSTGLGYLSAIPLPPALGLDARWGW